MFDLRLANDIIDDSEDLCAHLVLPLVIDSDCALEVEENLDDDYSNIEILLLDLLAGDSLNVAPSDEISAFMANTVAAHTNLDPPLW